MMSAKDYLEELLGLLGRDALRAMWFDPIEPDELGYHLAQCYSLSTYLPFATQSHNFLALHLWPGRDLAANPVVLVSTDNLEVRFIADSIATLPAAMTVQVSEYFSDIEELVKVSERLAPTMPSRQRPSNELKEWLSAREECFALWWYADAGERARRAWQLADVGHPFADLPHLSFTAEQDDVLELLRPFRGKESTRSPQVLSLVESVRRESEMPSNGIAVQRILESEAWLGFGKLASGIWRVAGHGLAEWDCTLRNIDDPQSVLGGTPFEPLIPHPGTYSDDPDGIMALRQIAASYRHQGRLAHALRQLRNVLLLHSLGVSYLDADLPGEEGADDDSSEWEVVLDEVVEVSAAIDPDGLATVLARELPALVSEGP